MNIHVAYVHQRGERWGFADSVVVVDTPPASPAEVEALKGKLSEFQGGSTIVLLTWNVLYERAS